MRRFLGGVTTGLVVGVGGLGALSIAAPHPEAPGQAALVAASSANAADPTPSPVPDSGVAALAEAPEPTTVAPPGTPAEGAEVSAGPDLADSPASPVEVAASEETASEEGEAEPPPQVAEAEQPPAPAMVEAPEAPTEAAPASDTAEGPSADPAPQPLPTEPPPEIAASVSALAPVAPAEAPEPPERDFAQRSVPEAPSPSVPASDSEPEPAEPAPPTPEVAAEVPIVPQPMPMTPEETAPAPEAVAALQPPPVAPAPAVSPDEPPVPDAPAEPVAAAAPGRVTLEGAALPGRDAVRVNRPGLDPAAEEAPPEPVPVEVPEGTPALERFAASWEAPAEPLPRMAFVLLDDGTASPETLAALPMPVSVALDPTASGAGDRMAALRAAGLEVLVLASLPPQPQPTDVEVFLTPALETLPEAVAVLDMGQGGLRGRDATAEMALSRLAREGLGAVLPSGGLGRGADGAEAAGVPAAEILRTLDGGDLAAIERQLNDGARRARQEGEAVLLARPDPSTLEALAAWTGEREAAGVTIAPISAVLAP